MPVFVRTYQVNFFEVEPLDRIGPARPTFEIGKFPADEVLDRIADLDLASGDFYVEESLTGRMTFGVVREGPLRILAAYTKDPYDTFETERKGEFIEHVMEDDMGVVEASFVGFFPNGVVAVMRTSPKTPGSAKIANWLSLFGGHPVYFSPLERADVVTRLHGPRHRFYGLDLRSKRAKVPIIREVQPSIAEALQAAGQLAYGENVGLYSGAGRADRDRIVWWRGMRPVVESLSEVLSEFDRAMVRVAGSEDDINLLDAYVRRRETIVMDDRRKPRAGDAAPGLVAAYEAEENAIYAALEARRRRRA